MHISLKKIRGIVNLIGIDYIFHKKKKNPSSLVGGRLPQMHPLVFKKKIVLKKKNNNIEFYL
jgi:hypothetical protein